MATTPLAMDFFALPMDILLLVLQELEGGTHKTISAMDIACSPSVRNEFWAALQHHAFILSGYGPSVKTHFGQYVTWINKHQLKLSQLHLKHSIIPGLLALDPQVLLGVRQLLTDRLDYDFLKRKSYNAVLQLMGSCVAVTKVVSTSPSVVPVLIQFPNLNLQSLECVVDGQAMTDIVNTFGNTLQELILFEHSPTVMRFPYANLVVQCVALTKLSLPRQCPSRAELLILLEGLQSLRDLSFHTVVEPPPFPDSVLLTLEDIAVLAPYFDKLVHLSFGCKKAIAMEVLAVVLRACPQICDLQLVEGLVGYKLVSNGCCLVVADVDRNQWSCYDSSRRFCDCLSACPLPIVELKVGPHLNLSADALRTITQLSGHCLSKIHWELAPKSWRSSDLCQLLASCPLLTSLTLARAWEYLDNATLLSIVRQCKQVQELSIFANYEVSDVGMAAALEKCGARLTKLALADCGRVKRHTLQAITLHCVSLRFLKVFSTGLRAPDIVAAIILPDKLKELVRLMVTGIMHKEILELCGDTMLPRWCRILCKEKKP